MWVELPSDVLSTPEAARSIHIDHYHIDEDTREWPGGATTSCEIDLALDRRVRSWRVHEKDGLQLAARREYDASGRITAVVVRLGNDAEHRIEFLYKTVNLPETGSSMTWLQKMALARAVELGDLCQLRDFIDEVAVVITNYDEERFHAVTMVYDNQQRVLERSLAEYDSSGRLLAESLTRAPEGLLVEDLDQVTDPVRRLATDALGMGIKTTMSYDEIGRCVELIHVIGPLGYRRVTWHYNHRGLVDRELCYTPIPIGFDTESLAGRDLLDVIGAIERPEAIASEISHSYEYDQRGAWMVRTSSQRHGPQEALVLSDRYIREIVYH